MKERRTSGRSGGSETLDQEQERAQKRRFLLESELAADETAELSSLVRQGQLGGLDGYAKWLDIRGKIGPCKVTRVELELALAERRQEPLMSPRSALAYAAWIVAAERGWHPSKTETNSANERGPALAEGSGLRALPVLPVSLVNPLRDEAKNEAKNEATPDANEEDHKDHDHEDNWAALGGASVRSIRSARTARSSQRPGSGQQLSTDLARRYAPHLGEGGARALSDARLHTDDEAAEIAASRGAHAVTYGADIYFGRGELAPGTQAGDELLVHELTHVAQGQRGEIYHAAAKLTSGISLEAGEAEAELRGKLAAIELHAPAARTPQVAAPSGQPASAGERAARIAAQKARLAEADRDTIPDTESKPAAQTAAEGAVNHAAPEMTAPQKPSGKSNAYVEALEEMPSKQALGAWSESGAKATTETKADQAAFDAALPPMPVELTGDDGKPAAKAEAGGGQASPKEAAGAVPPAAQPTTPTPPAPQVTAAAASVENLSQNQDPEALKAAGKKALDELPTTSPAVKSDPGTPPVTDLAGQADPVRATGDQQQAYADGAKGLDAEKKKILSGPGAAQIQPAKLNEKLDVPKSAPVEAMPELPKVEGMDKFKKWNLPSDVQGSFDNIAKPKMEANLAQARSKITEAEGKRDSDRDKAVTDAQSKVKAAHVDADAKQQAKVAESRTKITNKQSETLSKQEAEVKKLDKQSGDKKKATIGKINTRIAADQSKVETDYADAQKKADAERQKGEAEAQRQKEEAKKKEEDKSWWDRAVDAVCDAIKAVADAIDKALEAVGKLIGEILDAVKNAACALIDAARDFVCAALSEFGDWLKSAVTALLGSVFPELAAALNKFIDDAVNAAKEAVNAIADGLKSAVTALCDTLKNTINSVISAYRSAVQAAATLAKALVTGDWKAVAKMVLEGILSLLGIDPAAFYALIGKAEESIAKIIDDPGAFVGHLVDAVKLGFQQFGANFLTHLKDGVVQWLFGTFAEAGINIPATFDVAGVFDLTCQVLGLTWPRLRTKVVKVIGEENTERLEFVAKYVEAMVNGGFAGLWQQVQQDMSGLWDMVIGGAKQWLMEKLVQQAIIKVATMWNPAGAIIQLIQTAWNVYCWVKENAQRIFGLVQAVVDSISNIANGNIAGAANYIESSLAKLVPIAISLFANLLGLGGIADKIKDIITKVQTKIDQAIDKLIDRVAKMFKGKGKTDGKGKADGKGGKTDGKEDKKPDENKQVGKRITFKVGSDTHTQYIDKGVPMVASTPTGVKAKIEEWRPRLQQLDDAQKKKAGGLIGKAIGIEKKVAELAGQAKTDKSKEAPLEAKQQNLADTLAQLWEIMAPDMDPSKQFADQDPKATLKSDQYKQFKSRFLKLATDLQMQGGDAKAQEIWLQVVEALQKTDAAYKAAPTAGTSGRKDLAADGFKKIMGEFDPITNALKPYMEKWAKGKKSWGFWSGKPSLELAKKHAEVCLEKSALGGLFDNINISGGWDIQMWASLSKAYATHAAHSVGEAKLTGFVGMGSSADQSIFNKIEQPTFVGMLSEKQKAEVEIDWYAGACNPENVNQPDYRFKAGSVDGVYAKGDRASMVAKAEAENKRRVDLFKEKGINEGPNGSEGEKKDENKPVGGRIAFKVGNESHTQYIDDKGTPTVASTPTAVKSKLENEWKPRLQQLPEDAKKKAGGLISKAISAEKQVAELVGKVKANKATDAALQAKQQTLADTLAQLWEIMAPDLDPSKSFAEQDPKATLKSDQYKQFKQRFMKVATDLQMQGGDAKAQEIWLKVVDALQKTDAGYKAAPNAGTSGRKDLAADGFQKLMVEFNPITDALKPYMDKWTKGKKSWGFWSGKPAMELAKKHTEVCLERSALGGLFDGINISGGWDIQMWASLSKAYATHAAHAVGEAKLTGFVGMGSSADQSVFNKIEQPTFVGMLSEKQKVDLKIDWYAGACDPENPSKPDFRFKAGAIDGVYAKGDRASMVAKAEAENKRRVDLWKDKKINEGPNGSEGEKKDENKPVGARITFQVGAETHTQYIDDKGTPTVASTPTAVKKKVEDEWRPRLQQLPDDAKKKAGGLIGKAISIEKKVSELVGNVKAGKATEAALEAKQRELADTLAQLWELMAPDLDKTKPFAEQDPMSTLKSDQYKQFKPRFTKLAAELKMTGGDAKAQEIWLKNVEALQKTDAAYKAAPSDAKSGRKDLSADAFKKIMAEFDPITEALKPYMEKWAKGKKSWAFWSGKPALDVAKKHTEICLEKSALGGLFDGINISGGWDIQMWASLSKAYASHAAANVGDGHYAGFVGMGSSADQSIFNKIEQPTFVGMLNDKQKVTLKIDWYAAAGDPEKEMKTPDFRFKAGSIDGVYAKGDRPAMVEKAESENKRRLDLWKDKGINEGPGGAAGDAASDAPVIATGPMKEEEHKLTVDLKKGEIRLASIEADALVKVDNALTKVKGMTAPAARKKDAEKALTVIRRLIKQLYDSVSNYQNSKNKGPKPAAIDSMKEKADGIMAALKQYGTDFGVHDVVDLPVFDSAEDYKKLAEQVGGERLDKGIASWENNVKEAAFKEGTVEIWAGWKVKDVAAVKAPAIDILVKAAMDDKHPDGKADGSGKMDKLIAGASPTKVPFFSAAGELATKQAITDGKAKATKPETKQAIDKTSYVPGGDYGKLETPKNEAHSDPRLMRAVQAAGGIVAFMKGMATAKTAGGMTHADFEAAWADQKNVDYLKDEFRAADPGMHEWIPSNQIKEVITRAHSAKDLEQAAAWVELHHTLRCDTAHLIFSPSYAQGKENIGGTDYVILAGHVGALYLPNPSGGPKPSPSIVKQETWHGELRIIFDANKTIIACIDALRVKFRDTVWDGKAALPADVFTAYLDASGNPIDWSVRSKDQANRYAIVDACFENCRKALAKFV